MRKCTLKTQKTKRRSGKCPGAEEFYKRIHVAITEARLNLEGAQQRQKAYADTKMHEVKFKKGELVLLSTANLHIKRVGQGSFCIDLWGIFPCLKRSIGLL
jgi:hypothetical protein